MIGEIIALDRRERADGTTKFALKVIEEKYGFPVHAIVTMDEVIIYLQQEQRLSPELSQSLADYYAQYGGE